MSTFRGGVQEGYDVVGVESRGGGWGVLSWVVAESVFSPWERALKTECVWCCMKRRTVLKRASAVTGSLAVAGCLSEGSGGSDSTTEGSGGGSTTEGTTTEPTTEASMSVSGRSLETVSTGCGTENAAEVSFTESGASVSGKIPVSDPCHEAVFADVSLGDGGLVVTMAAEATDADACQQCLGVVEYSAGLETENGVPASVTVRHDAQGETSTVAESSR